MMRLSTMWKVDRTNDETGRSPVAERILEHWANDPGSARAFRSSANFIYVARRQGKRVFLRFADSSERDRDAIEAEMRLLAWLAAAGLDVALPIRSERGNVVETVETEWGRFHAVLFIGLEGDHLEFDALDGAHFHDWGAALGRLHVAMKSVPGSVVAARSSWRDHLEQIRAQIPEDAPAVGEEYERLVASLHALPIDEERFGLIHFDFELDNLFWHGRAVQMLDFDDAANYWYVADIAFALRDLFAGGVDLENGSLREFVRGYRAHASLDEEMRRHLPVFMRLANLFQFARIAHALDLNQSPDYPSWMNGLVARLHDRILAYRRTLEERGGNGQRN